MVRIVWHAGDVQSVCVNDDVWNILCIPALQSVIRVFYKQANITPAVLRESQVPRISNLVKYRGIMAIVNAKWNIGR